MENALKRNKHGMQKHAVADVEHLRPAKANKPLIQIHAHASVQHQCQTKVAATNGGTMRAVNVNASQACQLEVVQNHKPGLITNVNVNVQLICQINAAATNTLMKLHAQSSATILDHRHVQEVKNTTKTNVLVNVQLQCPQMVVNHL
jgi:hypothetical protein